MVLHEPRCRRHGFPAIALLAAFSSYFLASLAFTGPTRPLTLLKEDGRSVNVFMRQTVQGACKHKAKISPVNPNFKTAKEKQSERSKARKTAADRAKDKSYAQWPAEIPDGVTLLHVEYDTKPINAESADWARRTWSSFPKPGNQEISDFLRKIRSSFGPKVRVAFNEPRMMKDLVPYDNIEELRYRKGAFEVVNMNTGKLLFSKLKTGTSLVYEDYWDTFAKRLSEQMTA
ncbi:unnamed protein product [Effrenium voratum]|nr:unnamed protein product [Effrenium voratum]